MCINIFSNFIPDYLPDIYISFVVWTSRPVLPNINAISLLFRSFIETFLLNFHSQELKTQDSRSTLPWERTVRIRFSDFIFFNVNWLPSLPSCKAKNDKKIIIIINFYKIIGTCLRRLYKIGLNITPYMTNRCMYIYCCNCICNPTDQHHK